MQRLMAKVLEETKSRESADLARTTLETEIDNLTSSLFTEANRMVATERIARARAEDKMKALEETSSDMAGILDGLQGTLREKVELLDETEKEALELKRRLGIDVSDGTSVPDLASRSVLFSDGDHIVADFPPTASPSPGLALPSYLASTQSIVVNPQLLTSVLPYYEFIGFVNYLRRLRTTVLAQPPPESPGTVIGSRGFGVSAFAHSPASTSIHSPNYVSRENLVQTPAQLLAPHLPLSSHLAQPFLKRCIEEDSDPALRLDLAPGLGFLSRRTVSTAILDGTLLIEPTTPSSLLPSTTCCLCGVDLEKWWGSEIIIAEEKKVGVNSTMRKVLGVGKGTGSWGLSSFTGVGKRDVSPGAAPVSPGTTAPRVSLGEAPTLPLSNSTSTTPKSFSFPTPPHEHIHLFRPNDASSTTYAVCPNYCLPRLRAVCEFWNYVRVIERGLLVEEGFRFVGGTKGLGNLRGSTSSLHLVKQEPELESEEVVLGEKREAMLPEGVVEALAVVVEVATPVDETSVEAAKAAESEEKAVEGEVKEGETPAVENAPVAKADVPVAVEPEAPKEETDAEVKPVKAIEITPDGIASTEESEGELDLSTIVDVTHRFNSGAPPTSLIPSPVITSAFRPPVPKRSNARTAALPVAVDPPLPPIATGPPRPPPRNALRHGLARSIVTSSVVVDESPVVNGASVEPSNGWEERCWSEVVRLKEGMFWTRIGANGGDGQSVASRKLRVD